MTVMSDLEEPVWPHPTHPGCNYLAVRFDDGGLFCTKCGWGWSATQARLEIATAALKQATDELARMRSWKDEATTVLGMWDELMDVVPAEFSGRRLGMMWPKVVAAYIDSLETGEGA